MFVLDSHCDTPSQIMRLRDLSLDNRRGHVDFPKLRAGGVDASFFALYIPAQLSSDEAFDYARRMLAATRCAVDAAPREAAFARSVEQARANKEAGLISIFLGLENASPLGGDLSRMDWLAREGIRYVTLCHNADNLVCDSAAQGSTHHGLSALGRQMVRRMNEMNIVVDCAHISDEAFWDVLRCSKKSVVSTHSCCRALSGHRRNMTDEMIRALASEGGVIQINFYPVFLDVDFAEYLGQSCFDGADAAEAAFIANPADSDARARWERYEDMFAALPRPSYKKVVDHIDHVVDLVGMDYVGIGTDFDGISVTPEGLENVSALPVVFEEMRSRGYSEADIAKVAGENFLRVL